MHMSGNCYKVRLTAHQLGIPLTLKDYGEHDGATRLPDYLAKNPNGRVPMLELDDGRCLPESGAIIAWLSESTDLQPKDRWARAEMLQWMFFEQYSHEPYIAVARFVVKYMTPDQRAKRNADIPTLLERGNAALGVMETHLKARAWFAGDAYSIADIALYGYTHAATDGGFDLSKYPAIMKWLARVKAQPRHIPLDYNW